jgi:hypothetical protein
LIFLIFEINNTIIKLSGANIIPIANQRHPSLWFLIRPFLEAIAVVTIPNKSQIIRIHMYLSYPPNYCLYGFPPEADLPQA